MTNPPASVSIIMPAYNQEKYILESVRSIQNQTYRDWELIIVDDGSNDNTEEIIRQLDDERIRFVKAGRIGIAGEIKNIGLSNSNGMYIAFIDSDDLWADTKIEKQIKVMEQYPEAGFCLTGGYNFKIPGEPYEYYYQQRTGVKCDHLFIPFFRSEIAGFIQAVLFRKNCLQKTGYFKTTKPFSDIDFILSLAYHYKGIVLYEPLLHRRLHSTNHSSANWMKGYSNAADLIDSYKGLVSAKLRRDALFRLYINFGEAYLLRTQKLDAISQFLKAWKNKPFSVVPLKKIGKAVFFKR